MTNHSLPLDKDTSPDERKGDGGHLESTAKYAVYANPYTGVASVGPLVERRPSRGPRRETRLPQTIQSAARASRKRLRDHAVFHQLGACLVLTYRQYPNDPNGDVERFVRKARPFYSGKLHYAVVTEGAVEPGGIRLHHNVLLPANPALTAIADNWPHGDVFIGINPTDHDIRRMVNYVSKTFARSKGVSARCKKSKSKIPKSSKQVFNNKAEAEASFLSKVPVNASGVSVYMPVSGNRQVVYWDVNPHQIEHI